MTSPGVEIAAPPDSETVFLMVVFDKTTVGFTVAEPFSVVTIVVSTEIATPGVEKTPDASCGNAGFERESTVTFSIFTSVVALLEAIPNSSPSVILIGLTAIKGFPDSIPVPRSNVSKMRPSASVGAVIVMFVLISRVESRTIFFSVVGLVASPGFSGVPAATSGVWLLLVT